MRQRTLTLPEIGLIAGTRVALGVGIGLLIADKIDPEARKGAGCALLLVGVLSTIPIALSVLTRHGTTGTPESA